MKARDALEAFSKLHKASKSQLASKAILEWIEIQGGEAPKGEPQEVPDGVVLSALKFLSKPGQFLDPGVKRWADVSPTCAVAMAWLRLRKLCLLPDGQEIRLSDVAEELNNDEDAGLKLFIERLNSDIKKWLTYQGSVAGDLEKRLKVITDAQNSVSRFIGDSQNKQDTSRTE